MITDGGAARNIHLLSLETFLMSLDRIFTFFHFPLILILLSSLMYFHPSYFIIIIDLLLLFNLNLLFIYCYCMIFVVPGLVIEIYATFGWGLRCLVCK